MLLNELRSEIKYKYKTERAEHSKRFFKTGKGEYGEGDVFYGLSVPEIRTLSKKYIDLNLIDLGNLINSKVHEERLCALIILTLRFKKNLAERQEIFELYVKNYNNINNWDLVDLSAPNIVGNYLIDKDRKILYEFAKSDNLWKKRIAIIATFAFIRNEDFQDTIKISEILLDDKHDLIHKAVGWMLREVGKRNVKILENFLKKYYKTMPRTMLRYSIEKFEEKKRKMYLNGTIK
jgi:3-methyladenine DNA glycosylase AlkD